MSPVLAAQAKQVRWRGAALLQQLDPPAHARYHQIKYASGPNPSAARRRRAYGFAFQRLLMLTLPPAPGGHGTSTNPGT